VELLVEVVVVQDREACNVGVPIVVEEIAAVSAIDVWP
jgi:hypothetical protein